MESDALTNTPAVTVTQRRKARKTPLFIRLLRGLFRTLGPIAPGIMGRWAHRLWFSPRRHPRPVAEMEFLNRADRYQRLKLQGEDVAVFGWGRGPTVLMVHGWSGRSSQLMHFVEPLVAKGYSVLTFDFPGHGESGGHITTADVVEKIIADLAEREGGFAAVLSHSFGGVVTGLALRRGLQVDRSVMVCPPCTFQDMLAMYQTMLAIPDPAMAVMKARTQAMIQIPEGDVLTAVDTDRNMADSQVKGLLIHDEKDREVPFVQSERIAAAWPQSRLMRTRGLGHHRILRHPAVIDEAVAFLTGATD